MNIQPGINHVYRLAQASNGHQVVIKDKTVPFGSVANSSSSSMNRNNNNSYSGSLLSAKYNSPQSFNNKSASNQGMNYRGMMNINQPLPTIMTTSTPYAKTFEDKISAIMTMTADSNALRALSLSRSSPNKFARYLAKGNSVLNSFSTGLSALIKVSELMPQYCAVSQIVQRCFVE